MLVYLKIGIIGTSILLIILILLQQRGGSLGTLFGSMSSDSYRTYRGAEKFMHYATIAISIIWAGLLIVSMIVS